MADKEEMRSGRGGRGRFRGNQNSGGIRGKRKNTAGSTKKNSGRCAKKIKW